MRNFKEHLLLTQSTIREALIKLQDLAKDAILFVVDKEDKLLGSLTDGDIRRYLERNAEATMKGALHETIARDIMTQGSVTLHPQMIAGEALSILQARRIQLDRWMHETDDPLLRGRVPAPAGAKANDPDGISPQEPPQTL